MQFKAQENGLKKVRDATRPRKNCLIFCIMFIIILGTTSPHLSRGENGERAMKVSKYAYLSTAIARARAAWLKWNKNHVNELVLLFILVFFVLYNVAAVFCYSMIKRECICADFGWTSGFAGNANKTSLPNFVFRWASYFYLLQKSHDCEEEWFPFPLMPNNMDFLF